MFIPQIRLHPTESGVCVPLFAMQMPQKTLTRLNLGGRVWESFVKECMGIDVNQVSLLNTFIDLDTYCQVLTLALRLYGADRLLYWYVEDTAPSHLGPVGMACAMAPTVGDGLRHWLGNFNVMAPTLQVGQVESRRDLHIQLRVATDMGYVHDLYQEICLFMTRRKLLDLSGGRAEVQVRFAHAPLQKPDWYRDHFGTVPETGCATPSLVLDRHWLEQENEAYTPLLYQQALEECRQLQDNYRRFDRLSHRVRGLLVKASEQNRFYSLDQVARLLNLSVRTLTRRLSEESASFRDIQCQVRLELAKRQLQYTRLPIKAICSNAGFTNVSAFSRAFRKYTRLTPTDFRLAE